MSKAPKLIKVTFDISGHYPPKIVEKLGKNLKLVVEHFVRTMNLRDAVREVRVDAGSTDTFFHEEEQSIHLGEEMIRGIFTLQLDSQARIDYFNWIWRRELEPVRLHPGNLLCTCQYQPVLHPNVPVESRLLQVDLHMTLIVLHELTHAYIWKTAPMLAFACGSVGLPEEEDHHGEEFKQAFIQLWGQYGKELLVAVEKAGEVFGGE
jgi:hypothetical protein